MFTIEGIEIPLTPSNLESCWSWGAKSFLDAYLIFESNVDMDSRRWKIWIRDGLRCRYCRRKIWAEDCHVDHVVPKSRGGSDNPENLVCACSKCNLKKGARTPKEAGMKMLLFHIDENE